MAIKCIEVAFIGFATQILEGSGGTPGSTNTDWYRIIGIETDQATITGSGLGGNEIGVPNNGIGNAQDVG